MKKRISLLSLRILGLTFILGHLISCQRNSSELPPAEVPDHGISVSQVHELQKRINPLFPGRGTTDYPGNSVEDVPKSYAMVLLGELERKKHSGTSHFLNLEATAGQWLIEHADENHDGVIGWGVPVAWDAYGDGSINPAHTEYSISTAIVIDALLTWSQVVADPKSLEILKLVEEATLPYLDKASWTPAGMLPYSLRESDRKYDTFNSAMYLAGQFQRLSTLTKDDSLAIRLRTAADSTVEAHIAHKNINENSGAWYWNYSITEETPNDLPHAAYIIQGLLDYKNFGGAYAEKIDAPALLNHLEDFLPVNSDSNKVSARVRAWPNFRKDVDTPARSYDIGIALHVACSNLKTSRAKASLLNSVISYRSTNGEFLKYPSGTNLPQLVVAEYESYLFRGVSSCLSTGISHQRPTVFRKIEQSAPASKQFPLELKSDSTRAQEVAFVDLTGSYSNPRVFFTPISNQTHLNFMDGGSIKLEPSHLPISLLNTSTTETLISRSLSDGRLWIKNRNQNIKTEVRHKPDRYPIFRAAKYFEGHLHLIYYDNPTSTNWLVQFKNTKHGWRRIQGPIRLPSLQDPAGKTYEMIPRMEFVHFGKRLWITGGTLTAEVKIGHIASESRLVDCLRAIEVIGTQDGPLALCNSISGEKTAWILSSANSSVPIYSGDAIPWKLRTSEKGPQVDLASESGDLTALLARDLRRIQHSGWMEFGIDNDEGRIPWSQIYYLNGFLDILQLVKVNSNADKLFSPLIPLIKDRLDLEISLIDQRWKSGKFLTRAFTVDRSHALFAVQSARLLLLFDRYRNEVPRALPLSSYEDIRFSVHNLQHHIEELVSTDQRSSWMEREQPYLKWPKGSKFYFDGLNVPFNHQNEWAYSIIRTSFQDSNRKNEALAILSYFSENISSDGSLPASGEWNYWWGQAYDGWTASQKISTNKPSYDGDKIKAWISFRTIDVMSLISTYDSHATARDDRMIESAINLIQEGKVYPFAAYELLRLNLLVLPNRSIAHRYARVSSPWELQSAVWALLKLSSRHQ